MHWQFHGVFQKTLYTRKVADVTKLTDFTTLQTYRFVRLSQPRGPPAHARGLQHEALRRGGSAALQEGGGSEMSVVARRERCVNSFPRAHAHEERRGGDVEVKQGGGACEIRCGGAGLPQGEPVAFSSSGVPPVGWSRAGLRSCWEAGPRARAHA